MNFPKDFVWGTATSSFQIEGAAFEDGRGESIWDRFCRTPGKVLDAANGDVACDHYHRWPDDIALMKSLGMGAYRFSIAWPRIFASGRGTPNAKGLAFYDKLVDGLLEAGITSFATLYHWDLPQALQDEGGWTARSTGEAFVAYADAVTRVLGDRVRHWITHNEPWCIAFLSHQLGLHAPGLKDWRAAVLAAHHVMLSHGWAVPVLRQNSPGSEVGITLNFTPAEAASASLADHDAMRHFDGNFNRWFIDPLYGRRYPADMVRDYARLCAWDDAWVHAGDFDAMRAPLDFIGVNYYTREILRADVPEAQNLPVTNRAAPKEERTDIGWEVHADSLYEQLCRMHFEYRVPKLYVTENGAAYNDGPDAVGRVRDARRTAYLHSHLAACHRAIKAGVPLAGYFQWSLMDNFEWAEGYRQRFGMVYVDYETQRRIPKDSAHWYAGVARANALPAA
jgi:beta-glucosidase